METHQQTRKVPIERIKWCILLYEEHLKAFECLCVDGFTGLFCEHINTTDHLGYFFDTNLFLFSQMEKQTEQNFIINPLISEPPSIYQSCSTVFNGISFIFGGSRASRQVQKIYLLAYSRAELIGKLILRYSLFLSAIFSFLVICFLIYAKVHVELSMRILFQQFIYALIWRNKIPVEHLLLKKNQWQMIWTLWILMKRSKSVNYQAQIISILQPQLQIIKVITVQDRLQEAFKSIYVFDSGFPLAFGGIANNQLEMLVVNVLHFI